MFAMMLPVQYTGGMEMHAWELCEGLAKLGHSVTIITGRHPQGLKEERRNGINVYYTGDKATSTLPFSYWRESIKQFEKLLKSGNQFDVIHSQSVAALPYLTKGGLKRLGVPLVTTLHGTCAGEVKTVLKKRRSARMLLDVLTNIVSHFLTIPFVRSSKIVIVPTNKLASEVGRSFFLHPKRIFHINYGIRTDVFKPKLHGFLKNRYAASKDTKIILCVSRLIEEKGVQFLIQSMEEILRGMGRVLLVIVGDGPYLPKLEETTKKLGIGQNVVFCSVSRNELPKYYASCDIVVVPTIRVEGLPLVVLEAMSSGKPVVASKIGGICQAITNGVTGFLVEPKNTENLTDTIMSLLKNERLCKKIGGNARAMILQEYSARRMVNDTLRCYKLAIS